MTGELLLVSVVVGLFSSWLFGLVMGKGRHGVIGDLCLGLVGGPVAVWIYQAVGLVPYTGTVGGMVAAFMGAVAVVFVQRRLRHVGT